jgi:hypothetical protein
MPVLACSLRAPPGCRAGARARAILDAGFEGMGLEPPLALADWKAVRETVPAGCLRSLRLFLPFPRGLRPGEACPFRLGALHPEEKRDAEKHGGETVVFAERHAIPWVLLPAAAREGAPGAALASFLSTLARLLNAADRYAVQLALTPASGAHELPDAGEIEACFREFAGAPLALWPTAVAAEQPAPPGAARLAGVTIPAGHTREGLRREPLRALIDAAPIWLLDPPAAAPEANLATGRELLESLLRGPEKSPFV